MRPDPPCCLQVINFIKFVHLVNICTAQEMAILPTVLTPQAALSINIDKSDGQALKGLFLRKALHLEWKASDIHSTCHCFRKIRNIIAGPSLYGREIISSPRSVKAKLQVFSIGRNTNLSYSEQTRGNEIETRTFRIAIVNACLSWRAAFAIGDASKKISLVTWGVSRG